MEREREEEEKQKMLKYSVTGIFSIFQSTDYRPRFKILLCLLPSNMFFQYFSFSTSNYITSRF